MLTINDDSILTVQGLQKVYGSVAAADVPELRVRDGEFFTIVGPSGSGKSTLLGMLTGAVEPTTGTVYLRGKDITDAPPERRPTAMVFQSLALFPHMSVGENIEFPLEVRRMPKQERREKSHALMKQLRLPLDFYSKRVSQCSGGERQRIAIARALAYDPDILFFDEPLSAIDYRLRKTLEVELMDIHRVTGKTFIYVTHSLEEAMIMSDRMAIMRSGKIVQIGNAKEIYNSPANEFVAQFLGEVNTFEVSVDKIDANGVSLNCPELGKRLLAAPGGAAAPGENMKLIVRPENMHIVADGAAEENQIEVEIEHKLMLGSRVQYHARLGERKVLVEQLVQVGAEDRVLKANVGDRVHVAWERDGGILVS